MESGWTWQEWYPKLTTSSAGCTQTEHLQELLSLLLFGRMRPGIDALSTPVRLSWCLIQFPRIENQDLLTQWRSGHGILWSGRRCVEKWGAIMLQVVKAGGYHSSSPSFFRQVLVAFGPPYEYVVTWREAICHSSVSVASVGFGWLALLAIRWSHQI